MRSAILPVLILTASTLGIALLSGCADESPEIWIFENGIIDESCDTSAGSYLARGTFDVYMRDNYLMSPRFSSTLAPSGSVTPAGGSPRGNQGTAWEANLIAIDRAEIRYDAPDGIGVPLPSVQRIRLSGTISPRGTNFGRLDVIPSELGSILRESPLLRNRGDSFQLNVRVRVFGTTSGGRDVESNEFSFPVEVCKGCLVFIPPNAIDLAADITPNCRNLTGGDEGAGGICESIIGQDYPIDCRLVCPIMTALPNGDPLGVCEPTF
ncbi:MAG: hypothetical protein EA398_09610 [Deltaproteobacteria bacterium]|nr:MAG: hypothetical protein EA398_09610 [Deltaproteobacteria bacterium]